MRTAYTLLALTLLTLPSAPALGQNVLPELHGEVFSVENGEQAPQFFPNVQMTLREFGASGLTNDQGLFRIQLPGTCSQARKSPFATTRRATPSASPSWASSSF